MRSYTDFYTFHSNYMFTLEFLQALNDWQLGGNKVTSEKRGLELKKIASTLPPEFRTSSLACFRRIALGKNSVWDLIGENKLTEKISSWTFESQIALSFKGGVPKKGYQGAVFVTTPTLDNVILNIDKLYRDKEFQEAVKMQRPNIKHYSGGIGKYGPVQSEIVLEISSVNKADLYALGGYSSDREALVKEAAFQLFNRTPTDEEKAYLLELSEKASIQPGPGWVTFEQLERVLANVEPKAEIFRAMKKAQVRSGT